MGDTFQNAMENSVRGKGRAPRKVSDRRRDMDFGWVPSTWPVASVLRRSHSKAMGGTPKKHEEASDADTIYTISKKIRSWARNAERGGGGQKTERKERRADTLGKVLGERSQPGDARVIREGLAHNTEETKEEAAKRINRAAGSSPFKREGAAS